MSKTVAVFSSALLCLLFVTASLRAQGTPPPDFTGVYLSDRPVWPGGTRPRRGASASGGDSRRGLAAAATCVGSRWTCGPAGQRAEADA